MIDGTIQQRMKAEGEVEETKEPPAADLDDGFRGRPPAIGHLRGV